MLMKEQQEGICHLFPAYVYISACIVLEPMFIRL